MKLISFLILLCVSVLTYADETACVEVAGGTLHLFKGDYVVLIAENGRFITGTWETLGETKVLVKFDDGDLMLYEKNIFNKCIL